jgi:hypothetical protein
MGRKPIRSADEKLSVVMTMMRGEMTHEAPTGGPRAAARQSAIENTTSAAGWGWA